MTTPAEPVKTKPKRGQLILLMLLFFSPLLFAFVVYYGSHWRPLRRTNHGTLIEPALSLPSADFLAGQAGVTAALFSGKWSLAYVGDGQCDDDCRKTLYFMRQTQQTLGNLIPRTQRVWLGTDHCCDGSADISSDPPLIAVDAHSPAAARWLSNFPPDHRATTIFIIDPRGNLMMRYDSAEDPKGLREDLKKLLGLSHIG
jgi:cytochrome oxidase Cu insertion factor (SCO1/SenC/PrrC family)